MKPLASFSGKWNPSMQAIQFQWDARALGNDRYIYIIGIVGNGNDMRLDMTQLSLLDVRNPANQSNSSLIKRITNGRAGVFKMLFCGFSSPLAAGSQNEASVIEACRNDPSFLTTVMMGQASITCQIGTSVQDNAKVVTFDITSNCEISPGVLGYQYHCDNMVITIDFPGVIAKGRTEFKPIAIPKNCDINVVPFDKQFAGNLEIKQKNKLFGF